MAHILHLSGGMSILRLITLTLVSSVWTFSIFAQDLLTFLEHQQKNPLIRGKVSPEAARDIERLSKYVDATAKATSTNTVAVTNSAPQAGSMKAHWNAIMDNMKALKTNLTTPIRATNVMSGVQQAKATPSLITSNAAVSVNLRQLQK